MPAPREFAIVTCSCGWRLGDVRSGTIEIADTEELILRANVTKMYRHYQLGHRLTGKREYRGIIEDEALRLYERERTEAP